MRVKCEGFCGGLPAELAFYLSSTGRSVRLVRRQPVLYQLLQDRLWRTTDYRHLIRDSHSSAGIGEAPAARCTTTSNASVVSVASSDRADSGNTAGGSIASV